MTHQSPSSNTESHSIIISLRENAQRPIAANKADTTNPGRLSNPSLSALRTGTTRPDPRLSDLRTPISLPEP